MISFAFIHLINVLFAFIHPSASISLLVYLHTLNYLSVPKKAFKCASDLIHTWKLWKSSLVSD